MGFFNRLYYRPISWQNAFDSGYDAVLYRCTKDGLFATIAKEPVCIVCGSKKVELITEKELKHESEIAWADEDLTGFKWNGVSCGGNTYIDGNDTELNLTLSYGFQKHETQNGVLHFENKTNSFSVPNDVPFTIEYATYWFCDRDNRFLLMRVMNRGVPYDISGRLEYSVDSKQELFLKSLVPRCRCCVQPMRQVDIGSSLNFYLNNQKMTGQLKGLINRGNAKRICIVVDGDVVNLPVEIMETSIS